MKDLEVAHIFPHALMSLNKGEQMMVRQAVGTQAIEHVRPIPRISGWDIDRPFNALTLTKDAHTMFGNFEIAFEHLGGHTYKIDYVNPQELLSLLDLPVTRTLFITPDRSVDPPSVELLKLHYAIARITHMRGAGEYIDNILRRIDQTDERQLSANGSTPIDHYIRLKPGFGEELSVH
ncbi:hypothetical protein AFLA70_71g003660 [Aspergillus flavus AF70]|nr:hypothetical protein AFLA70_71g003660 [Aspergillus flavus AF70]